jgi:formylglycine-generating enzyme required for sulfatase activity
MDYVYEAKDDDPPVLKRKVIRGGSWKDIGYYLQTGTRTYEYQDTAKSYIGFRNVMSFLGRAKGDDI